MTFLTVCFSIPSLATESPMMNLTTAGDRVMFYLAIYGGLAGANSLFTLLRAFLFAYGGICAAQKIHKDLLSSVLKVTFGPTHKNMALIAWVLTLFRC